MEIHLKTRIIIFTVTSQTSCQKTRKLFNKNTKIYLKCLKKLSRTSKAELIIANPRFVSFDEVSYLTIGDVPDVDF